AEHAADSGTNQLSRNGVGALELAFVFQFEFAGDRRKRGIDVRDASDAALFTVAGGALFGVADNAFQRGDGQPLAHAGASVHALVFARLKGDLFDYFAKIVADFDATTGIPAGPGLLPGDGHTFGYGGRVVCANFGTDPVLQRCDDLAARGVVLRIRGENQQ